MANGENPSTESEEFVLRSNVRYGLKREFAFALQAQSEFPASLCRTRSGKSRAFASPPSTAACRPQVKKRQRKSDGDVKAASPARVPSMSPGFNLTENEAPVILNSEDPDMKSLEASNEVETPKVVADCKDDALMDACEPKKEASIETTAVEAIVNVAEPQNGVNSDSPVVVEGRGESAPASPAKPIKVFVRSPMRGRVLEKVPPIVSSSGFRIKTPARTSVNEGECKLVCDSLENGLAVGDQMVMDSSSRLSTENLRLENLENRNPTLMEEDALQSAVGNAALPVVVIETQSLSDAPASTSDDEGERRLFCDSLENRLAVEDSMVMDSSSRLSTESLRLEILEITNPTLMGENALQSAVENAALPVVVIETQSLSDAQSTADNVEGEEMDNGLLGKSMTMLTRSALTSSPSMQVEGPMVDSSASKEHRNDNLEGDSCLLEQTVGSYPISALKSKREVSVIGEVSSTISEACGSEETSGLCSVDASLSSSPNKKMELKMSKKISLTKVPRNVKELISTGLLEGLPVKYAASSGRQTELHGVIKGNGILCSCPSCAGSTVVSAYVFEQHARSTKKHPSDFIYLENGSNLRDIVNACTSAPLDMLEAAIEGAIGPRPVKTPFTCKKCNGCFTSPSSGNFTFICDKCLDPKQLPTSTSPCSDSLSFRLSTASPAPCSQDLASNNMSMNKKSSSGRLTRKDLGLHKLVFSKGILPEGTEVSYFVRGKNLRNGYIEGSGIHCDCCEKVVSPSQFEAHAGQAARRKPYNNIYTSNGVSLHELSVSLSKGRKAEGESDDLCSLCTNGGDLMLCDLCPRAFHKECLGFERVPEGEWHCQYCISLHQRERCLASNDNAIAAGRVAGVDPIKQIFQRCIRIVKKQEVEESCVLCRLHHFSRSGFDDHTVIICDMCDKEYHIGCLREHKMDDLKELPPGEWFCCTECRSIRKSLEELILCGYQLLPSSCADFIRKKCMSKGVATAAVCDIKWRVIRGKSASEDLKYILAEAIEIFHESFKPMGDSGSECDLIPVMVHGEVKDEDYRGMHCIILSVGPSVVSTAIFRVLGSSIAELPLVATGREHQGMGYFMALFSCIERLLASLNIKHLVLPAADEAESLWIDRCGFMRTTNDQLHKYLNGARMMSFSDTSVLHKLVPSSEIEFQEEKDGNHF